MDILWTSYGHPAYSDQKKVFTSYGHIVVDILWTSYGHIAYSDQKRSSHPMGILWTSCLGVVATSNDVPNNVMCCFGAS